MNFQIKKIILWPKKTDLKYKEIEFKLNTINIITGASRTGKSAIIPIIDYCLGSESCHVPVKIIRDACSWFGILINVNEKQILIARQEPGEKKSTDNMYMIEGETVDIPITPEKNTKRQYVKKYFDELARLSFLDIEADTTNGYYGRPSFRDLMAFCFQPQNIMANADTLFYRADTTEHRNKLVSIFPYILGAINADILAKRQELSILVKMLSNKEQELRKLKEVSEKWNSEIIGWLDAAKEYGLIKTDIEVSNLSFEEQLELLEELVQKDMTDISILPNNIQSTSEEIIELRKEENEISMQLSKYQSRYMEMSQLTTSIERYRESLSIQVNRLHISKWLMDQYQDGSICPICKNHFIDKSKLELFYNRLQEIEGEADSTKQIPVAFEREYENVKKEISHLSNRLSAVQKRLQIQSEARDALNESRYTINAIERFIGKIQYANETFIAIGTDSELVESIEKLKKRIQVLKNEVDERLINKKIDDALIRISGHSMKLTSELDLESPNDPIKVDYKNLTVVITDKNSRENYLWEIGSGSNWLAYHIAVTLGFHIFFADMKYSPVPNFIVYDQPSQVYFPQKLAGSEKDKELDPILKEDEDRLAVKKIFTTFARGNKLMKDNMQIIVLEHADESVWGEVKEIHKVCEWRGENEKLIPREWIN